MNSGARKHPSTAGGPPGDAIAPGPGADGACSGAESFALMVVGGAMAPEFVDGDIIVVEPGGRAVSGSYVLAWCNDEWMLRQLIREGESWYLKCSGPGHADIRLDGLEAVRGVIIQKSKPGRRRATVRYVG